MFIATIHNEVMFVAEFRVFSTIFDHVTSELLVRELYDDIGIHCGEFTSLVHDLCFD